MSAAKKVLLSPSMMCADIAALPEALRAFEAAGIDYLHIDVMDGVFVPNLMLGTDYARRLRALTSIPLDIHLMITAPEPKIAWFDPQPGEYVSVHQESTPHLHRALQTVRASGAKALAALNPATPLSAIETILEDMDGALLMLVNPGYAGQALIPEALRKVADLRALADARGLSDFVIQVDGNIGFSNVRDIVGAGADFLVLGSSSVFTKDCPLPEAIRRFKDAIR
ncbi:MAG: ribulose-phosphate 3-epimerase [Clostridiales Family XIII bacterium]|jgi:ribulose-phosphate 3-epimerase|nr:ribulose-phosphate 3-epimerase [Clostridiales Family XIII bacterium]